MKNSRSVVRLPQVSDHCSYGLKGVETKKSFFWMSTCWIWEAKTQTIHYYDIWHVARSLWKKLLKASKEGGCEKISSWMKGIRRHLYWCATSTKPGFGALIVAKWSSFLRHVANIHSDHPNELYKKCHKERYIIMITIIQQLEKYLLVKQKNQYFYIFIVTYYLTCRN